MVIIVTSMTVGIPGALGYHRYGVLWETFFRELGVPYVVSDSANFGRLSEGAKHTADESCLPLKIYMGHVSSLLERSDLILVPYFRKLGPDDEFCVRFWGLYDMVQNTFEGVKLLTYPLLSGRAAHRLSGFVQMGAAIEKDPLSSARAYYRALRQQQRADIDRMARGQEVLSGAGPKILLAAQPYVAYDPMLGGTVARLICAHGALPLFSDAWNRDVCRNRSRELSPSLYWTTNREIMGAILQAKNQVDGVILLSAFPCGSDCLTNELILRRVHDLPIIQIVLDDSQGMAGLETRVESFLDMVVQRKKAI